MRVGQRTPSLVSKTLSCFPSLEKAFEREPRVVLWVVQVVEAPEWFVSIVQAMYNDAKCPVRVNG